MNVRLLLASLSLAALALPALAPTAAAGCLAREVDGPAGLRLVYVQVGVGPGPICVFDAIVYLCEAHADVDPNAPSANVWFDNCVGYDVRDILS